MSTTIPMTPEIESWFQRLMSEFDPDQVYLVVLDKWRGFRLVVDTVGSRKCQNNCQSCRNFQLFGEQQSGLKEEGFIPELKRWTEKQDKDLYGPERYLQCKTLDRYAECYIRCLLEDCSTKEAVLEELQLVRQFTVLYAGSQDLELTKNLICAKIIYTVLGQVGIEKRRWMTIALSELGWRRDHWE